jgi:hypothetical protein
VGDEHAIPSDVRRVVDRMSDRDWHGLILQLGRYALHRSRRFYWRTGHSGELPYGEMTDSIVSKAFVLWLTGRRRWNPAEYPDLPSFLRGVIDSLLSHFANGYDNRNFELRSSNFDDTPHSSGATPESDLLAHERAAEADRLLSDIIQHSQQDAVVIEIIDAMRNGAGTRRDIVKVTGRPAEVIDNGLKRLRRIGANVAQSGRIGKELKP